MLVCWVNIKYWSILYKYIPLVIQVLVRPWAMVAQFGPHQAEIVMKL